MNKTLGLYHLKNMHIDDIIRLYKLGYRLDFSPYEIDKISNIINIVYNNISYIDNIDNINIKNLAVANPTVISSTGFRTEEESTALVLFDNRGGRGYIRIHGLSDDSLLTDNVTGCFDPTVTLLNLAVLNFPKRLRSVEISIFRCVEEAQNCDATPPKCLQEILSQPPVTAMMRTKSDIIPSSPEPLTVKPGNGLIDIKWSEITNATIFAFGIRILFEGSEIQSGFVPASVRSVTILQLVPDRTYTVEVSGLSESNIKGEVASIEVLVPITTTASTNFIITGPQGRVEGASIIVDGVEKGITDINGELNVLNLISSAEGTPHEYLITKEELNNRVGTITSFPGISSIENVTMTRFTPGRGTVIYRVICGGKACEGAYVGFQGIVRGATNKEGILISENLTPGIAIPITAWTPGTLTANPSVDVIENTTTRSPLIVLRPGDPALGIIVFTMIDQFGKPVQGAQVTADTKAFFITRADGVSLDDKMPIGFKYSYLITRAGFDQIRGEINLDSPLNYNIVVVYVAGITVREENGAVRLIRKDPAGRFVDLVLITVDEKQTSLAFFNQDFFFRNLTPGKHTYRASREGYKEATGEFMVEAGTMNNPTDVDIILEKIE